METPTEIQAQVSQIFDLNLIRQLKSQALSDKGKMVYAYHFLEQGDLTRGYELLTAISQEYYKEGLFKDLARALLVYTLRDLSGIDPAEYEFYLIVYRLTKRFSNVEFGAKGVAAPFHALRNELFKGFDLGT